jgi:hypothetical protein
VTVAIKTVTSHFYSAFQPSNPSTAPYLSSPPFPLLLLHISHHVCHLRLLSCVPHLLIPEPVCHSTFPSFLSLNSFHPVYHSAVPPLYVIQRLPPSLQSQSPMRPMYHFTVATLFVTPQPHPYLSFNSCHSVCHSTVLCTLSVIIQFPPCLSLQSSHPSVTSQLHPVYHSKVPTLLSRHSSLCVTRKFPSFCQSAAPTLSDTPQSHHVCHLKLLASRIALYGSPLVCSLHCPTISVNPQSHHICHSTVPPYRPPPQSHYIGHSTIPPCLSLHSPTICVTPKSHQNGHSTVPPSLYLYNFFSVCHSKPHPEYYFAVSSLHCTTHCLSLNCYLIVCHYTVHRTHAFSRSLHSLPPFFRPKNTHLVCHSTVSTFCTYNIMLFSHTLQRRPDLFIPRNETARLHSQFPHSCICERFINSQDRLFCRSKIGRPILGIYKSLTDT